MRFSCESVYGGVIAAARGTLAGLSEGGLLRLVGGLHFVLVFFAGDEDAEAAEVFLKACNEAFLSSLSAFLCDFARSAMVAGALRF